MVTLWYMRVPDSKYGDCSMMDKTDALARMKDAREVPIMNARGSDIGDEGAILLASKTELVNLNVRCNNITHKGAAVLVTNTTIQCLNLRSNRLKNLGAEAIAKTRSLVRLNVQENVITSTGAQALANNTTLTWLNIGYNEIRDEGAIALASNTYIEWLGCHNNKLTDAGARTLFCNTTLTKLDISRNDTSSACTKALVTNTTLFSLIFNNGSVRDEGAENISLNTTLRRLDLTWNCIGNAGATALAQNNQIRRLDLSKNRLERSSHAFAANAGITRLRINNAALSDTWVMDLAHNTTLTELDLKGNNVSLYAARSLVCNVPLLRLHVDCGVPEEMMDAIEDKKCSSIEVFVTMVSAVAKLRLLQLKRRLYVYFALRASDSSHTCACFLFFSKLFIPFSSCVASFTCFFRSARFSRLETPFLSRALSNKRLPFSLNSSSG